MRFTKVLFTLMFITTVLFAQEQTPELRSKYGIFGHLANNIHNLNYSKVPDCIDCSTTDQRRDGIGFAFGLAYEMPLSLMFAFELRLSYYSLQSLINNYENRVYSTNYYPILAVAERRIEANFASIGIEPMLKFNPYDAIFINVGCHIGTLINKEFIHKISIMSPAQFTFSNGTNTVYMPTKSLSNPPSIYLAPIIGISYQASILKSKTLILEPELYYAFGLSEFMSDWTTNSIRCGIALKYTPSNN